MKPFTRRFLSVVSALENEGVKVTPERIKRIEFPLKNGYSWLNVVDFYLKNKMVCYNTTRCE